MQCVFRHTGYATTGTMLLGNLKCNFDALCTRIRINSTTSASTTTLSMMEDDVVIQSITIPPRVEQMTYDVWIEVSSGSEITFQVATGPALNARSNLTVVLDYYVSSYAQGANGTSLLTVRWESSAERIVLFNYSTSTHAYTETVSGISTDRATIANGSISIKAATVLTIENTGLEASSWHADRLSVVSGDKLVFLVGNAVVGELTSEGFKVSSIYTETTPSYSDTAFAFHDSSGVLQATLDQSGLLTVNKGVSLLS